MQHLANSPVPHPSLSTLQLPNPERGMTPNELGQMWKLLPTIVSLDGRTPSPQKPQLIVAIDPNCPHTAEIVRTIIKPLTQQNGKSALDVVLLVAGSREEARKFVTTSGLGTSAITMVDPNRRMLAAIPHSESLRSGTLVLTDGKGGAWEYPTTTRESLTSLHRRAVSATGAALNNPAIALSDSKIKQLYIGCAIITSPTPHDH